MVQIDLADLRHAAGEQGVSYGCGEHDGDEDGVLRGLQGVLHKRVAARSHARCAACIKGIKV